MYEQNKRCITYTAYQKFPGIKLKITFTPRIWFKIEVIKFALMRVRMLLQNT